MDHSDGNATTAAQVGDRLRRLREARGKKREHLALALGMTAENWRHYEKGRSQLLVSMMPPIAETLDMSVSDFARALLDDQPGPESAPLSRDNANHNACSVLRDGVRLYPSRVLVAAGV